MESKYSPIDRNDPAQTEFHQLSSVILNPFKSYRSENSDIPTKTIVEAIEITNRFGQYFFSYTINFVLLMIGLASQYTQFHLDSAKLFCSYDITTDNLINYEIAESITTTISFLLVGILNDSNGRKSTIEGNIIGIAICSLLFMIVPSYWGKLLTRILYAINSMMVIIPFIHIIETVPHPIQLYVLMGLGLGWGIGAAFPVILMKVINSWLLFEGIVAIPIIICAVSILFAIDESLMYLNDVKGAHKDAKAQIEYASKPICGSLDRRFDFRLVKSNSYSDSFMKSIRRNFHIPLRMYLIVTYICFVLVNILYESTSFISYKVYLLHTENSSMSDLDQVNSIYFTKAICSELHTVNVSDVIFVILQVFLGIGILLGITCEYFSIRLTPLYSSVCVIVMMFTANFYPSIQLLLIQIGIVRIFCIIIYFYLMLSLMRMMDIASRSVITGTILCLSHVLSTLMKTFHHSWWIGLGFYVIVNFLVILAILLSVMTYFHAKYLAIAKTLMPLYKPEEEEQSDGTLKHESTKSFNFSNILLAIGNDQEN